MRSALKSVRGLGVSRNAVHHWWLQRVTAIALIPMVIWFTSRIICTAGCNSQLTKIFKTETSLIIFAFALCTMLFHATLGVKVVIEDYVHCKYLKPTLIILTNLFAWFTAGFLLFVIIKNFVAII